MFMRFFFFGNIGGIRASLRTTRLILRGPEVNGQVNPPIVTHSHSSNTKPLDSTPRNFIIRQLESWLSSIT